MVKISPSFPPAYVKALRKTLQLLEREDIPHFILGGLAVSIMAEPRFTYDLDLDLLLPKERAVELLPKFKKASFKINLQEAKQDVQNFGTFHLFYKNVRVDCILASTPLEHEAFRRSKKRHLFGRRASFPSEEDLLLLKIIPGRPKDLEDAKSLVLRHGPHLDVKYLEHWAQAVCDEAEDFRVMRILKELLKEAK